jgi:hypothetical protein
MPAAICSTRPLMAPPARAAEKAAAPEKAAEKLPAFALDLFSFTRGLWSPSGTTPRELLRDPVMTKRQVVDVEVRPSDTGRQLGQVVRIRRGDDVQTFFQPLADLARQVVDWAIRKPAGKAG